MNLILVGAGCFALGVVAGWAGNQAYRISHYRKVLWGPRPVRRLRLEAWRPEGR